jgi:hypothetical protein
VTGDKSVFFSGFSRFLHQSTDRHDIAEIKLKAALSTKKPQTKSNIEALSKVLKQLSGEKIS